MPSAHFSDKPVYRPQAVVAGLGRPLPHGSSLGISQRQCTSTISLAGAPLRQLLLPSPELLHPPQSLVPALQELRTGLERATPACSDPHELRASRGRSRDEFSDKGRQRHLKAE